jgi:hypothetical protein
LRRAPLDIGEGAVIARFRIFRTRETMKTSAFAAIAFGALALASCGRGNQDQINASEANALDESLDNLSDQAANVAAEAEVLENQAQQLNQEAQSQDNAAGPETPADEIIAGM